MKTIRKPGQRQSNRVLCIVTDAHNCHAMTEELIDIWWHSLAPEAKAEIYEAQLDAEPQPSAQPFITVHGNQLIGESAALRSAAFLDCVAEVGRAAKLQLEVRRLTGKGIADA